MINQFNTALDDLQDFVDQTSKDLNIPFFFERFREIKQIKDTTKCLEEGKNTSEFFGLVKNANDFKTCRFRFMGETYHLTYTDRRRLINYPLFALGMIFLVKRTGGLKRIFRAYILLSALLCRENFNLRNYKLKN